MSTTTNHNALSTTDPGSRGSLRTTGLMFFVPLTIISIILISGLIYLRGRRVIENLVNTQLNSNLEIIQSDINQWLTTRLTHLDLATRQDSFQKALKDNLLSSDRSDPRFTLTRETLLASLEQSNPRGEELLFDHFFIALPDGTIRVASDPAWELQDISRTAFFTDLFNSQGSMIVDQPKPLSGTEIFIFTSYPYADVDSEHIATVFGVSRSSSLVRLLENGVRSNPSAKGYLITGNGVFIRIDPDQKILNRREPSKNQADLLLPMLERASLFDLELEGQILQTTSFDGTPVIVDFAWLPAMKSGIVVEVPVEVALGDLNTLGPYTAGVAMFLGIVVFSIIWFGTKRLVNPLQLLTRAAEAFAQGDWTRRAPETAQNNEIGQLSRAFNRMANELSASYRSLEAQVLERTSTLEKRSQQLEATAIVAREAAGIRNLDEMLTYLTYLISEHFGYYHVGIFLLDETRTYAVLQAANSAGGQSMLARSHRLEVGRVGVVGHVAATGLPRIALDVGADAYYFDNPDLPGTRSELALPLKIRNQIIGILDVQSTQSAAFEETDVEVLQILADQIALSIHNARLSEQSQSVIHELSLTRGNQMSTGWSRWIQSQVIAYAFDRVRLKPATSTQLESARLQKTSQPNIKNDAEGSTLVVPIQLRDQKLGSIMLQRDRNAPGWTKDDLALVIDSIAQIALALENARLLAETMRRAEYEQTVSEFATQIARTIDIDSILRTAVSELGRLPNITDVSIHLDPLAED